MLRWTSSPMSESFRASRTCFRCGSTSQIAAMVVSWTLIGYGRAVAWELPILGVDFTLWRIVISLPIPVLAGALGRFVYVRMYPQGAEPPS